MDHVNIDFHLGDLVMLSFYHILLLKASIIQQNVQVSTCCLTANHLANKSIFLIFNAHNRISH